MSIFEPAPPPWPGRMLSILRIVAGVVFVTTGTMKVFGFPHVPQVPPFTFPSEMGIAGVLETFGGTAFTLGLFTRPLSFIFAGEMAVAYFQFHFPLSVFPQINNGTPAILYCFLFLYFVASGAGDWSIDAMIARSRATRIS